MSLLRIQPASRFFEVPYPILEHFIDFCHPQDILLTACPPLPEIVDVFLPLSHSCGEFNESPHNVKLPQGTPMGP